MPVFGSLGIVAILWQLVTCAKRPIKELLKNPVAPIVTFVLFVGLVRVHMETTRYFYFLYPVLLTVMALSLKQVFEALERRGWLTFSCPSPVVAIGFLAIFAIGEDFNIQHIWSVNNPKVEYRLGEFGRFEDHWFYRHDFLRPAEFVAENSEPGDPIILTGRVRPAGYYLSRDYYLFVPESSPMYRDTVSLSEEKVAFDYWSGNLVLDSLERISALISETGVVWIVKHAQSVPYELELVVEEIWPSAPVAYERLFTGEDGRIEVIRVELNKPNSSRMDGEN